MSSSESGGETFSSRSPNFNLKQGISYAEFRVSGWFFVCDCGSSYSFFGCGMWGQNRRQNVFNRGILDLCGVAWHSKNLTKTQVIHSVSCFNLGGLETLFRGRLEALFGGAKPIKAPMWRRYFVRFGLGLFRWGGQLCPRPGYALRQKWKKLATKTNAFASEQTVRKPHKLRKSCTFPTLGLRNEMTRCTSSVSPQSTRNLSAI